MFKKFLVGGVLVSVALIAFTWHKLTSQTQSITTPDQVQQTSGADVQQQSSQPADVKPQVVSDAELARLQSYGKVSEDGKYYIKDANPFPQIVSLDTGNAYTLKPADNYTQVSNLAWSPDSKYLAFTYTSSDPAYANRQLLGVVALSDVLNKSYTPPTVPIFADKINFLWLDSSRVLFTQLLGYDSVKRFYNTTSANVYDVSTQQLENPWVTAAQNIYSIDISPSKDKVLYVQAQLDDSGNTSGREYVVADLSGNVVSQSETYNANWASSTTNSQP